MTWTERLSRDFSSALSLMTNDRCVSCGEGDLPLCPACETLLGAQVAHPGWAQNRAPALERTRLEVMASGNYTTVLARTVLAFKRLGQPWLCRRLASGLAAAVLEFGHRRPGVLVLVPVPGSRTAYLRRGFDPVQILLRETTRQLRRRRPDLELSVVRVLSHRRSGQLPGQHLLPGRASGQKGLGARKRASRTRGSFRISLLWSMRQRLANLAQGHRSALPIHDGVRVLLVDDVLTTGATLAAASRALRSAGINVAGAVVVAAARPPRVEKDPADTQEEIR